MKKQDSIAIVALGAIVAVSFVFIFIDTGLNAKVTGITGMPFAWLLLLAFIPPAAFLGLWIFAFLSKKISVLFQIGKFGAVGVSNTAVDLGVFSILKFLTGSTFGLAVAGINVPGFALAVINSYFWNKYWTFKKTEETISATKATGEFLQFIIVSVIGLGINSGLVYAFTTFMEPQFGLSQNLWATGVKIIATPVSFAWNFVGYKFIVFKK